MVRECCKLVLLRKHVIKALMIVANSKMRRQGLQANILSSPVIMNYEKNSTSYVINWLLHCLLTKSSDHVNDAVFVVEKWDIIIILSILPVRSCLWIKQTVMLS